MRLTTWGFVLNVIEVDCALPFEIAPHITFARATKEEIQTIRETLLSLTQGVAFEEPSRRYEYEYLPPSGGQTKGYSGKKLPDDELRYYVVHSPDANNTNLNLHFASFFSKLPIDLGTLYFHHQGGMGYSPLVLAKYFWAPSYEAPLRVGLEDLIDFKTCYALWMERTERKDDGSSYPELSRAVELYDSLKFLPTHSQFYVIGLFAIIELLITHNPDLEDRGDSLTHQIRSKIPLLMHHFKFPVPISSFFKNPDEKKIWEALYAYRSAIAHGGIPDFVKKLKILENEDAAKRFLTMAVRALIRFGFEQPDFYRDLKKC